MYDINLKNVKKGKGFYLIFFGIGILTLIIICGFLVYSYNKYNSMDASVIASEIEISSKTDSDSGTMYSPVYHYVVDGNEYVCSSHASSSIYPNNFDEHVYYKLSNPKECVTGYDKKGSVFVYLFLIIPVVFIIFSFVGISKVNKRVRIIKQLNQNGKLVKNLPYYLADSNIRVNGRVIQKIMVNYTLSSGSVITLEGDPRYDGKVSDSDGFVDLVIDESNPNNYFIDFEINRLSGNRQDDYFQQVNQPSTVFDKPNNNPNNIF